MSNMIGDKLVTPCYLRLADNGVTLEVSTNNSTWSGISYAALGGAAFTGSVSVGGVTLTPATQPTAAEKAAMTAANTPGADNAFATIADLADPRYLGWYATSAALIAAHATGTSGQYAIVGETDTVWTWDADSSAWVGSGGGGAVVSVNGQTGTVVLVKGDVGLGNVDNTADTNKPVSTAQQAAINSVVTIPAAVDVENENYGLPYTVMSTDITDGEILNWTFDNSLIDSIGGVAVSGGTSVTYVAASGDTPAYASLVGQWTCTPTDMPISNNPWSVAGWFKTTGTGSFWGWGRFYSAGDGVSLKLNSSGDITLERGWGEYSTAAKNLNNGAWHHIVVTYANSVFQTYIDGVLDASYSYTMAIATRSTYFGYGWNQPFSGTYNVFDWRVYNRAITSAEVAVIYSRSKPIYGAPTPGTPSAASQVLFRAPANNSLHFAAASALPISTATQTALDGKVATSLTVNGHALTGNVTVSKSDVGLGNVDNTADTDKPVSTATAAALTGKVALPVVSASQTTVTTSYAASAATADIHRIALTAATACALTVSDIAVGAALVIRCNNAAAGSLTFGGSTLVSASETGVYYLTFCNVTGTIEYTGKAVVGG